jgi:hypothetical protein|nr:MAG TPA: large terminase [Caudoviricetes sp.]
MVVERTRDEILAHENDKEYMANRVDWVKGKILDVSDYRKISVDSNEELMILAKIGQLMADEVVPGAKLFFTQAVLVGAAMLSRELADKFGLDFEKYRSVLMVTPTRYGKLCHDDTPVLTTKGWKKHGDLEPGDVIFHPSGKPTVVVSKTPKMDVNYKVVFDNGEEIYTHANHEWQVYLGKSKVPRIVETRELDGVKKSAYFVDTTEPCKFITNDQPFDPYLLGCWLGGAPIDTDGKKMTKAYGGYNSKHIPDVYKYASTIEQKLLLAGLIDTVGRVDGHGVITVKVSPERVANDLAEMLTVMGIDHSKVKPTFFGRKTHYKISFSLPYNIPTFRFRRFQTAPRKRIGIVKVEKVENAGQGNCIMVDSSDGMYLVGESLIPTHNSFLNAFIAIANAALGGKEVRIGGATRDKAGLIQEKVVGLLPSASKEIQDGLVITDDDGDVNKKVQRLATQASKEALAWKSGGSIKLFSTNETKKSADIAAAGAVGVGGDVVLLDEIQIMSPVGFRTASRFFMENNDTKRFCVGNPQINGHFRDLYDDPTTFVVHMNDSSAIIEGRMTRRQMELTGMPTYSNEYRAFVTCVDEQTECLTPEGWKSIKDIKEGDIVAQIEKDETLTFVPVQHKIEHISETIYKTSFAKDEWLFTKGHRQYVYNTSRKTGKTEKKVYTIENLPKGSHIRILSGGVNHNNKGVSYLDRLAIACQADGSIEHIYTGRYKGKPKGLTSWRIEMRKPRKIERLKHILDNSGVEYNIYIQKDGDTRFTFSLPSKITKTLSDWFGWEIGSEDAKTILDEIMEWDGCKTSKRYSSVVKDNVDFVQAIASQCGIRTYSFSTVMRTGTTLYDVYLHATNIRTTQYLKRQEINWGKPVYCITVPSGEWVARRNGHVINTGNCEFPPDNSGNRFFTTLPSVYDKTAFPTPSQKISFMGIDSAYKGADSLIVTIVTLNISPERIWVSLDYQEDMKTRYPVWDDTMTTLNICLDVLKLVERYGIERVSIDIGMGVQLYETLLRLSPDLDIEPVAFGSLPTEWRAETDFNAKWALNKRAEMHLDLKELCESQMMFIAPEYYDDLIKQIREVGNSEQGQKIKIEAKKEIKRRLGQSPDALDSLCLAVRSLVLSGILRGENDASVDDMVQVYGGQ